MITNTQIRNALTGALAVMALGLLVSCSDTMVAPAEDAASFQGPSAEVVQEPLTSCALVDGVWVCSTTETETTTSDSRQQCIMIEGVMHCEPVDGA